MFSSRAVLLAGFLAFRLAAQVGGSINNPALPAAPGGGGTPGFQPSQLQGGCGVEYTSGLNFTVGSCQYTIAGQPYSTAITNVTLSAADPSNPRLDAIIVDNTSTTSVLTGTAAATPACPTFDPSTQLELTCILVPANSSTPSTSIVTIYQENTEFTCTPSTNFNCASTTNPFRGTKDIEATTAVLNNNVTLVDPAAATFQLSNFNFLVFYIRSKATWPAGNGSGANGLRTLSIFFKNGSTQQGFAVVLRDGQFGFSSGITNVYQQIAVPVSLFGTGNTLLTTLEYQITGNGGSSSIGFYLDSITLQSGFGGGGVPSGNTTLTIAPSQSVTLGTSAITNGTCATVVTVSAPGVCNPNNCVVTPDVLKCSFSSDPTGVTGYNPTGGAQPLTIIPYPTLNNMNVKVCNFTGSSITPGAITLNCGVNR